MAGRGHEHGVDLGDDLAVLIEAQKPFLTKQLELYFETAQVVGELVTTAVTDPEWVKVERRF